MEHNSMEALIAWKGLGTFIITRVSECKDCKI